MTLERIRELQEVMREERISYDELHEIDCAADAAKIEIVEGMMADDILEALEVIANPGK